MNRLPSLLIGALIAFAAVSCMKDDPQVPVPPIDFNRVYRANTFTTSSIFMATSQGWVQDTAFIRTYLNRLIAEEKDPGFLKKNVTLPLDEQQELSFANEKALLREGGEQKEYRYLLANYNSILWMIQTDTITYFDNDKPLAIDRLGKVTPLYYKETSVDPSTGYDYQIRTVPENYAFIGKDILQFAKFSYHLKAKNGWEGSGSMKNFVNESVTQYLATGDTLLVQTYLLNFK